MFKLAPEAAQPLKKVGAVDAALTAAENIVFLLLGKWDFAVLRGSLLGLATAVAFFAMICISVPRALDLGDEIMVKRRIAAGRMGRLLVTAAGVILAIELSFFNAVAALIPILFFNRVSIAIVNIKSKGE